MEDRKREPIIRVENYGKASHLFFAGIDIGRAVREFSFNQEKDNVSDPAIEIEISIDKLIKSLSRASDEQLKEAAQIILNYVDWERSDDKYDCAVEMSNIAAEKVKNAIREPKLMAEALEYIKSAQESFAETDYGKELQKMLESQERDSQPPEESTAE